MEPLLVFADDLERRDAAVARSLDAAERLEREVAELRADAAATAAFLEALPASLDARRAEEHAALEARAQAEEARREAEAALERARREDERLAAERALQEARDDAHSADRWGEEAREALRRLEREGEVRRAEAVVLEERAEALGARLPDVGTPDGGLEATLDWASRARGALLVERSSLARERDAIVREASELVGSVLGEPLAATAVAGVRERLERALRH